MIFLETERLILRNVISGDAAVMHDYRNDIRCAKYQRGQTKDLEGLCQLVERRKADQLTDQENCLVAVTLKDGTMVGEIVVMPNDGCFSLGYTFHYAYHRRGYGFEALSALTQYLHKTYPDMEFISFTEPQNVASRRLLEKLGYKDMGYIDSLTSQMYGKWIKEDPT